jgi:ribosomal protein S10
MGIGSRTGVPLKGPEYDALTRFRKYVRWRPGERKAAKTSFNRRVRHRQIDLEDDAERRREGVGPRVSVTCSPGRGRGPR